jgi:amino acid transporter
VVRPAARLSPSCFAAFAFVVATVGLSAVGAPMGPVGPRPAQTTPTSGPVANFTAAVNRLVELVGLAGGGILALVWARVAFSWFSNDLTKKVQAKDRARDALIGTLLFVAAVTGLVYALAHWVVTGT